MTGAQGRNRTTDTVIFSHVLYQLSYLGAGGQAAETASRGPVYRDRRRGCPASRAIGAGRRIHGFPRAGEPNSRSRATCRAEGPTASGRSTGASRFGEQTQFALPRDLPSGRPDGERSLDRRVPIWRSNPIRAPARPAER